MVFQSRAGNPYRAFRNLNQRFLNELPGKTAQEIAYFCRVSSERAQCFAYLRIEVSFERRQQFVPDPVSRQCVVVVRWVRPKRLPDLSEPGFEFRSANLKHWPNQSHTVFGWTIFQGAFPEHPSQASYAGAAHEVVEHGLCLIVCGMRNGDRSALLFVSDPD